MVWMIDWVRNLGFLLSFELVVWVHVGAHWDLGEYFWNCRELLTSKAEPWHSPIHARKTQNGPGISEHVFICFFLQLDDSYYAPEKPFMLFSSSYIKTTHVLSWASQVVLVLKNPPAGDIRDAGSVPESGRSPGGGHGNPLQYSCLENTMCINFLSSQLEMIMPTLTHRVFSQRQIT